MVRANNFLLFRVTKVVLQESANCFDKGPDALGFVGHIVSVAATWQKLLQSI